MYIYRIKVENVDNLNQKSIITIANGKLIRKWQQWWWHCYNSLGWILDKGNFSMCFIHLV